eukprot:g3172.t1
MKQPPNCAHLAQPVFLEFAQQIFKLGGPKKSILKRVVLVKGGEVSTKSFFFTKLLLITKEYSFRWDKNGKVLGEVWAWCGVEAMVWSSCWGGWRVVRGTNPQQVCWWSGTWLVRRGVSGRRPWCGFRRQGPRPGCRIRVPTGHFSQLFHDLGTCARAPEACCRPGSMPLRSQGNVLKEHRVLAGWGGGLGC